jgi:hypothetical protein
MSRFYQCALFMRLNSFNLLLERIATDPCQKEISFFGKFILVFFFDVLYSKCKLASISSSSSCFGLSLIKEYWTKLNKKYLLHFLYPKSVKWTLNVEFFKRSGHLILLCLYEWERFVFNL